ncbi:MAG TPA: hypothetical protein VNC84_05815 [Gammaproteobacteria bacterium]|jgi:hypothetical protein|nr:hypothetical protein [Gammaproteobacteria bacterium]
MKTLVSIVCLLLYSFLLTGCATDNPNTPGLQDYNMRSQPTGGQDAAMAAAKTY